MLAPKSIVIKRFYFSKNAEVKRRKQEDIDTMIIIMEEPEKNLPDLLHHLRCPLSSKFK